MITFIHTSDWHIGNSFTHFDRETGKKLNRARLTAVETIFVYARKKKIPLILCAGDTMDNGQLAPEKNLLDLLAIIKKYPGITVVMITGNHDPLMANTIYQRVAQENYPPNLHLVKETNKILPIESMNLNIFASSTKEKNGRYNPLSWIEADDIDKSKVNIGLAHGSIKNEKFAVNCFPIEPDFAIKMKLDYLALGDWHSYSKINERTYYCGTPEPLQFGDNGFPLEVTIEKRGAIPTVEKVTGIQQYQWERQELEISDNQFEDFREKLESKGEKEIKKIKITGFLSPENYKIYKELLQMNVTRYYEIDDQVSLTSDADDLMSIDDGYIKDVVKQLMEIKNSEKPIPEEISNGIIPVDQLSIEQSIKVTKNEIIDKALLKMYKYYSQGSKK